MKIKIRKFRKEDAAQVLALNRALSAVHNVTMATTAKQIIKAFLKDKLAMCFVAEVERQIVGFIISYDWMNFEYGTRVCTVTQLYTHEGFRRSGVGLALMQRVAADVVKRGCFRLEVSAAKDNKMANVFYKKTGFFLRENKSNRYVLQGDTLPQFSQPKATRP